MRRASTLAIAGAVFCFLSVALTWPLAAHLSGDLPHDLGDPLLTSWILWWHAHTVPFTTAWWDGVGFYPAPGSLALSDHRVGLSLITTPLLWLGASPTLGYNIALLLSFALSATSMFGLVLVLTRRYEAAALAGVVFGFAPYRLGHVEHLEIISSYWMPAALACLHLWLRGRETRFLALCAVCWVMQALTCGYYLFYFSVLLGLWAVWFLRSWRRDVAPVALAGALSFITILPVLLRYKGIHDAFGMTRGIQEIESFSADISGLLSGIPWLAGSWISERLSKAEGQIFPGVVAALLVLVTAARSVPREGRSRARRARATLLGLALAALSAAASVHILGPWRLGWGPLTVSVSQAAKPLSIAFLALVAYGMSSRVFLAAYRRQSAFVFYATATLCMWMLAFGPAPRLLGHRVLYKAPYAWLMVLPGFRDGLRAPARFAMLASLCLAAAAGIALVRLLRGRNATAATGITVIVLALAIADAWPHAFPLVQVPPILEIPDIPSGPLAVVELPLGGVAQDTRAIYNSIAHRRPVVNGYSGYDPPHYALLRVAMGLRDPGALDFARRRTTLLIAIHEMEDPGHAWEQYARDLPDVRFLERSKGVAFYLADRENARGPEPALTPAPIRALQATDASESLDRLRDGRLDTWWMTPVPQHGGEQIVAELTSAQDICGVGLAMGPIIGDFPRALDLAVSGDGLAWASAWSGQTAGLAVDAAVRDPLRVELRIEIPRQPSVRFARLRQIGRDVEHRWGIAELQMLECPGALNSR